MIREPHDWQRDPDGRHEKCANTVPVSGSEAVRCAYCTAIGRRAFTLVPTRYDTIEGFTPKTFGTWLTREYGKVTILKGNPARCPGYDLRVERHALRIMVALGVLAFLVVVGISTLMFVANAQMTLDQLSHRWHWPVFFATPIVLYVLVGFILHSLDGLTTNRKRVDQLRKGWLPVVESTFGTPAKERHDFERWLGHSVRIDIRNQKPEFQADCPNCGAPGAIDSRHALAVDGKVETKPGGPLRGIWTFTGMTCPACMTSYTMEAKTGDAGIESIIH